MGEIHQENSVATHLSHSHALTGRKSLWVRRGCVNACIVKTSKNFQDVSNARENLCLGPSPLLLIKSSWPG